MKVLEIFQSIDGEVNYWGQGSQTTFIRFAGCNLRCSYCDTPNSQLTKEAKEMTPQEIVTQVYTEKVTLTGGEPLLQKKEDLQYLLSLFWLQPRQISIETNGTISLIPFFGAINLSFIVDYKLNIPRKNIKAEFQMLRYQDFIKFPICSRDDYLNASSIAKEFNLNYRARIAFSPIGVSTKQLLAWLQEDCLDFVVLNVQLHKLLDLK